MYLSSCCHLSVIVPHRITVLSFLFTIPPFGSFNRFFCSTLSLQFPFYVKRLTFFQLLFHVCNLFALYFLPTQPPVCHGGEYQRKLYRDLMENYNRLERPVQNDSAPIVVELGLTLLQIIDVVSAYLCEAADGKIVECLGISPGQQMWLFLALFMHIIYI